MLLGDPETVQAQEMQRALQKVKPRAGPEMARTLNALPCLCTDPSAVTEALVISDVGTPPMSTCVATSLHGDTGAIAKVSL